MKLNIAILMYGQPRTWRYCAPWIKSAFSTGIRRGVFSELTSVDALHPVFSTSNLADVHVDFFGATKTYNTYPNTGSVITEIVSDSEISELKTEFNFKAFTSTSIEEDTAKFLREGDYHFSRMFSSICAANELKRQYELETNTLYDIVVFHRFDALTGPTPHAYIDSLLHHHKEPMSIYTSTPQNFRMYLELWRSGFDDMIFSCDGLGADLLTAWLYRLFENDDTHNNQVDYRVGPNLVISRAVSELNLLRRHINGVELAIARKEADLSKPVFESFNYHSQFWIDNHISQK